MCRVCVSVSRGGIACPKSEDRQQARYAAIDRHPWKPLQVRDRVGWSEGGSISYHNLICTWATYSWSWGMFVSFVVDDSFLSFLPQIKATCRHFTCGGQTAVRARACVCVCVFGLRAYFFGHTQRHEEVGRDGEAEDGSAFVLWPSITLRSYPCMYFIGLCRHHEYLFAAFQRQFELKNQRQEQPGHVQLQTAFWVSIVLHPHEPQACPFVGGFHFHTHTHSRTHSRTHSLTPPSQESNRSDWFGLVWSKWPTPRNTFWCLREQT